MFAKKLYLILAFVLMITLFGCSSAKPEESQISSPETEQVATELHSTSQDTNIITEPEIEEHSDDVTLLYMGQASVRIITEDNRVIYIDPYAGDFYDLPADLILVTHAHFDHSQIDKVENRNLNCQIITQEQAIRNGEHQTFDFDFVTVEAVEAGYNDWHDVNECVGYVLTFRNGKSVYVTGDTSTTRQMCELSEKDIDYAFFCCDGVYNMGLEESSECAELVGAKYSIPYHVTTTTSDNMFDLERAEQFQAENLLIIEPGEEIEIH